MTPKADKATKPDKWAAIYVRVSSNAQDHKSQTPDLKRWAESHDGPAKWYRDKRSGVTMDRKDFNRLMDHLRAGKVDRVVTWRLDRLGRTTKGLCELFDELRERKVDLVSLRDGFNLDSAGGRMHARILASVAEFETEARSERILAGMTAARMDSWSCQKCGAKFQNIDPCPCPECGSADARCTKKGKRWGGSTPGGYRVVTKEQIRTILKMAADGTMLAKVARAVGLSRPTVYRVLKNERALPRKKR